MAMIIPNVVTTTNQKTLLASHTRAARSSCSYTPSLKPVTPSCSDPK